MIVALFFNSQVGIPSLRPKALNCFGGWCVCVCVCVEKSLERCFLLAAEIVTTTGMHYFSVDSTDEREEWIESIRKSSVSWLINLNHMR